MEIRLKSSCCAINGIKHGHPGAPVELVFGHSLVKAQ